jgi:mono/diheme cytochrome c family protein
MPSRSGDPKSDLPLWLAGMLIGAALILIATLSYQLGESRGRAALEQDIAAGYASPKLLKLAGVTVETGAAKPAAEEKPAEKPSGPGLEQFKTTCGGCHTLAAAGTSGKTGPNLDTIKPDDAKVQHAISNGGASGSGAMPKNLLQGAQAEEVAAFVAKYAGQ